MEKIIQMDVLQRKIGEEEYAFIGVAYPESCENFTEGVGYLMDCTCDPPLIYSDRIIERPYNYSQSSIDGIITSDNWLPTYQKGSCLVRMIPLGRGEPGFVIYGVNRDPLFETDSYDSITSFSNGRFELDDSDFDAGSLPIGSLLYRLPVWRNLSGEIILPTPLNSYAKRCVSQINEKRVQLFTGEITKKEFMDWVSRDKDREFYSRFGKDDPRYYEYLYELKRMGILGKDLDWMKPAEQKQFHHQCTLISHKVVKPFQHSKSSNDPGF